jgi:capsular polysaccharide biosynthesis protein
MLPTRSRGTPSPAQGPAVAAEVPAQRPAPGPARPAGPEPIRVDPLDAGRRHWRTVLLAVVVLALAGGAIGLARHPTYTAQATLTVADINVSAPGALSGFATASSTFADTWSRSVHAEPIVSSVATQLHLSQAAVLDRISASAVPESPLLRVRATGSTTGGPVALANATANALVAYISDPVTDKTESTRALHRARAAAVQLSRDEVRANLARALYNRSASVAHTATVELTRARLKESRLRFDNARRTYQRISEKQGAEPKPRVLIAARASSSDRRSRFELFVIGGVFAGLAIGLAVAMMRAQRSPRRGVG